MEELKRKMEKCCEMAEKLWQGLDEECCKGEGDCKKAGEIADMIKDISEVEKNLAEACYYKCIAKAMHEEDQQRELMGKMGYNPNRYADGRYAPSGHGNFTSMGFHPSGHEFGMDRMPLWMMEEDMGRMGYSDGGQGGNSNASGSRGSSSNGTSGGSGRSGYHESHEEMIDEVVKKYQTSTSPEEKRRIKERFQQAMAKMA